MKKRGPASIILIMLFMLSNNVVAQDIKVSDLNLTDWVWGNQNLTCQIENTSGNYEQLVITAYQEYGGEDLTPFRSERHSLFMAPSSEQMFDMPIDIIGNYGTCKLTFSVYSVIDTLDQLQESQLVFSKELIHTFEMPEELRTAIDGKINTPTFVRQTPTFDNHFHRVLAFLLGRGKNTDEIATMTGATRDYIDQSLARLEEYGCLEMSGGVPTLSFNIITDERAKGLMPAINKAVDGIYDMIVKNLPAYDSSLQAMIAAGEATSQKDNIVDPSSVLHHKHPVIQGLFLWNILGREFVNDGKRFVILWKSDPCVAEMGEFMHLVSGPESNMSGGFYLYVIEKKSYRIHCGTDPMPIICRTVNKDRKARGYTSQWSFVRSESPIFYAYTDEKVQKPVSMLIDGTIPYLEGLKNTLGEEFGSANEQKFIKGTRYWCWNLVVTKIMEKLEAEKLVEKEGFGYYSLQKAMFEW